MSELKPCPFCGKDAERKKNDYKVACSDSGTCPASQQWSDPEDWNRRDARRSEMEAAREKLIQAVRADKCPRAFSANVTYALAELDALDAATQARKGAGEP